MSDKEALSHLKLLLIENDNDLLEYRYNLFANYIEYENDLNGAADEITNYNLKRFLLQFVEAKKLLDKNL
tara:strand:+ start:1022 stop:1231 length:210 start_codon:yes stop_codon:yes gene_type:complete